MPSHSLRIVYAAGPGDVAGTYRHWAAGRDDPSQVAMTYSGQFYEFCRENNAAGFVISSNLRKETIINGQFRIEHRPTFFVRGPGPLYHLGQILSGLRLVTSAVWFRANLVVVADGAHWFVLGMLSWFGIRVVPTLHCVLWPKSQPRSGAFNQAIWKLNARFFRRQVMAVMSLSNDITTQVRELVGDRAIPIVPFLPSYRAESFGDGFGPPPTAPPFRVFFAGRIERNKGVFDLLSIARGFAVHGHGDVEFDLCGDGSQLEVLREAVDEARLTRTFRCHGHSTKPFMRDMYQRCHVVIVPTTSDFVEGFNKVVAEAVLAGRPVITSSVCPALEYVRDAVLEVPADQPAAYGEAIIRLKTDSILFQSKIAASAAVRAQFYDEKRSWRAALEVITKLLPER